LLSLEGHTVGGNGDRAINVGPRNLDLHLISRLVWGLASSPDDKQLASAGQDGTVRIWHAARGQELLILRGHTGAVRGVVFSPDSKRLASAGDDATVRVW
jgi:WD40 repeat protein